MKWQQRGWTRLVVLLAVAVCVAACAARPADEKTYDKADGNLRTRHVPEIPARLSGGLRQYSSVRKATFLGWLGEELLIGTRFGQITQLHRVAAPLAMREQLTFADEPVGSAVVPPVRQPTGFVFARDSGGAEFYQYYHYELATGRTRLLTDGRSRYSTLVWSADGERFAYTTTQRNGRDNDVHVRDVDGNRYATLETSEGFWAALDFSADGTRLLLLQYLSANRSRLFEMDVATSEAVPLFDSQADGDVEASFGMAQYDRNGDVYFTADLGAEFMRLHHFDRSSGRIEVITGDVPWDVEYFQVSPDRSLLAYSINEDGLSRLMVVGLPERQFIALPALPMGVIRGFAFSADGQRLALNLEQPTAPADVHVLDLGSRSLVRWTRSETGGLKGSDFTEPVLIRYPSFDGREIPVFVYLPDGPGPHPAVIYIHGGPESQYRPRLSSNFQYLVNELRIAVIAPNVRGSRGYGKSFLQLDDGRAREDSVKDIGALLDWVAVTEELDDRHVGVWGGSYGGYMVLASLVHFGDRIAAGAASVGISNFVTFLENTQPYRRDLRRVEYGDERDAEMRAFLEAISPLRRAGEITTPALISHGRNDPRVPAAESEQIVSELESNGVPVWYVLALDEGHGFKKRRNRDYLDAATMFFFERHLTQHAR